MEMNEALIIFDALSQETRLKALRLLVQAGPKGLSAGVLSERLGTPQNTLSFHLNHLANARVVSSRKSGRSVIYSANYALIHHLIGFLVKDCCRDEWAVLQEDAGQGQSVIRLKIDCQDESCS